MARGTIMLADAPMAAAKRQVASQAMLGDRAQPAEAAA